MNGDNVKGMLLIAAVVLGCNYYGPDNPPPDVDPVSAFSVRTFTNSPGAPVAVIACPSGAVATGGGCHCTDCSGAAVGVFGCEPVANGWIAGCLGGCADVDVRCEISLNGAGSISAALSTPDPEALAKAAQWQAELGARH